MTVLLGSASVPSSGAMPNAQTASAVGCDMSACDLSTCQACPGCPGPCCPCVSGQ
jgi:hypothetical protein